MADVGCGTAAIKAGVKVGPRLSRRPLCLGVLPLCLRPDPASRGLKPTYWHTPSTFMMAPRGGMLAGTEPTHRAQSRDSAAIPQRVVQYPIL